MKLRVSTVLYALLALGVLFGVWKSCSGASGVEARLEELGELIGKEGEEGRLEAVERARRLGSFFTRDFEVHLPPAGRTITDRQGLARIFLRYRSGPSRIGVAFRDRELHTDERLGTAELETLAAVTSWWGAGGGLSRERYRLRFSWVEEGGTWRIRRVELLEVLDGPRGGR